MGRMSLSLPLSFAREMASNFLGEEEPVSETQLMDMLKEVCNMICGNLFSQMDRGTAWNLTIPEAKRIARCGIEASPRSPAGLGDGFAIDFYAGSHRIQLCIECSAEQI
jgi:hypothetical protein